MRSRDDGQRDGAYTLFAQSHLKPLLQFAYRRWPEDAEDIVAETLLTAWSRFDRIDQADPLPFLYSVARNKALHHHRAQMRRRRRYEGPRVAPADEVAGWNLRLDVTAALAKLSESDQLILTLLAWEELTAGEIAQVLGTSTVAARVRIHRARARLRRAMGTIEEDHQPSISKGGTDDKIPHTA